jgi:hypothetical protein
MPLSPSSDNLLLGNYACFLAELDGSGLPLGERHVGNASAITLQVEPDILEKNERMTSARGLYKQVARQTKMTLKLTLDEITVENLSLGVLGSLVAFGQSSGTLTDHEVTADSVKGLYYSTGKRSISSVSVKADSVTQTVGEDYTVDAANGRIYIVPTGGIADGATVTVSCSYAAVASNTVRLGTDPNLRRYVRLVGDPTTGATHDYEFWNVQLSPDGELALISDEFASIGLTGAVTLDSTNHPNEPFGRAIERVAA